LIKFVGSKETEDQILTFHMKSSLDPKTFSNETWAFPQALVRLGLAKKFDGP